MPCKNYNDELEFIECGKKSLWKRFGSRINCTIPGLDEIIPSNVAIPKCDSIANAGKTFSTMQSITNFKSGQANLNCATPCTHTSFKVQVKYVHKNSYIDVNRSTDEPVNKTVAFDIHYNSLLVEERSEAYMYDLESLMTSVGGNLGLFLGFSCFSTLMFLIKYLFKGCVSKKQVIFPT